MTLNLGLNEEPERIKFRSKYSALISLLGIKPDAKIFKKESAIINRIVKLGFTEIQIYGAYNYYSNQKNKKIDSFAFFLWEKGKLIKDIIPLLSLKEPEKVKLDDKDYRDSKDFTPPKDKIIDFLS